MRVSRTTAPQHGRNDQRCGDQVASPRPLTSHALAALQRSAGNRAVATLLQRQDDEAAGDQVRSVLRSGGAPLNTAFRARAEQFLGADLSQVRVHTGGAAADSAHAVGARAYTSGSNVVFGQGMYDTSSSAGQHRLAHELTHVVQQQRGPVAGKPTADGLKISDPSDRFEHEADQLGAAFVAGRSTVASAPPVPSSVQRAADEGEEVLQMQVGAHNRTLAPLPCPGTEPASRTPRRQEPLPIVQRKALAELPTPIGQFVDNDQNRIMWLS